MKGRRDCRGSGHGEESLLEFFRRSPLWGRGIDIKRQDDFGREVDLAWTGPAQWPDAGQSANPTTRA